MKDFTDLLNAPCKVHGRSKEEGFDCYGLVLECCRRNGTPLLDLDWKAADIPSCELSKVAEGANVRKIEKPVAGCIVEMDYNGKGHLGFMVDRNNVMHMTKNGAKCSYIKAVKATAFYKVVEL